MSEIDFSKLARLAQHLLPATDLTLAVLKAHLLIEEELEDVVLSHCKSPEVLQSGQVTFATKLLFSRALTGEDEFRLIWDGCQRLNSLRNVLAHKLEHPGVQDRLLAFLSAMDRFDIEWDVTSDQTWDFRRKVIYLHGAIQGINKPISTAGWGIVS